MKRSIFLVFCMAICLVNVSAQFKMSEGSKKLITTMTIIENMYVDKIDDQKLSEDAIKSLIEKLDPHSTYISASEVKEMNEPLEGNFDGIGIAFQMMTDTLYVIETISGGPSERVGILPGDRVVSVNDTIIAGVKKTTKDIMSRLRGKKGTTVNLKVARRSSLELLDFKITRAKIPIYSLDAAYMVDNHIGYIRISRFGATTTKEFKEACTKLKAEGMTNLILDLEGNGGGYLSAAIELADEFLDKDKLIVYTQGTHQPKQEVSSTGKGLFETGKLAILINEGSASASEIVSGAVQDWDRGVVIGRRSFGKGLVQRQIPLPDESQLRLTVARYYTPTGRSIQRPYTNGDSESYHKDVIERYNKGEMMNADSIHFPDSLKYKTLVKERIVYGGGGIMPDYFVPIDTTQYSSYLRNLIYRGIINKTALNEIDTHRSQLLANYPTIKEFKRDYTISDETLNKLIESAKEEKMVLVDTISAKTSEDKAIPNKDKVVEFKREEYERSKQLIMMQIKALMARDLYDMAAYFKIMNDNSETFKKAVEIMKSEKEYNELLNRK